MTGPPARPAGTGTPRGGGEHVWERAWRVWDAIFWVLLALIAVATVLTTEVHGARRVAELVLLGLLGGWYVLVGRPGLTGRGERWAVTYVIGVIVLSVAAYAVYPLYGFMLFILFP